MVLSIAKVKWVMVVARTVAGISVMVAAVSVPQGWVIGTIAIKPSQSAKVDTIPAASRLATGGV